MSELEAKILRMLLDKPKHSRSFSVAKGVVDSLVRRGLVERCVGPGTVHKNYVSITALGRKAIGVPPKGFKRAVVQIALPVNDDAPIFTPDTPNG